MTDQQRFEASPPPAQPSQPLVDLVTNALDDAKAVDIVVLDVADKTTITDHMVIASGTSTRHVRTLAEAVVQRGKEQGADILGVEGEGDADWVLVDLADVLVHVMLPRTRAFYALEKLWSVDERPAAEA